MAQRLQKSTSVGTYRLYHLTTVVTGQAITDLPGGVPTHGSFLGLVTANKIGTSTTLTIYNGNPSSAGTAIGIIGSLTQSQSFFYEGVLDQGLYVTSTGSGFDFTISYLDQVV